MRSINIGDLKARLSAHIQMVREGEEVLICERNKPVARIIPCTVEDQSERERRLIARGLLLPPLRKRRFSSRRPKPPGNISSEAIKQLWQEEREDR
jgi:prevent-host-death family protein